MKVDCCIVGSGAGGAAVAYSLQKQGINTVILEKGGIAQSFKNHID